MLQLRSVAEEHPLPPIQLPLTLAQRHSNQQLFSDHYLNITLPQRAEWQLLAHDAGVALAAIGPIVRAYVPSQNEAQTEDDLIKPVLRALGHTFEVQASLKTPDGTKKPDYVFYRDAAGLAANKNRTLDEAALQGRAFAVGDAKYWDRPLDITLKQAGGDLFTNKNPAYQIAFYIQHSGVEWGILTNGRLWRLYHKDSAHKQDRFYEVDLPALAEANDPEAFLYFRFSVSYNLARSGYASLISACRLGSVLVLFAINKRFSLSPVSPSPTPPPPSARPSATWRCGITAEARARYELHRKARNRILADLGTPDKALNQKLTAWWALDFPAFRAEVQKVFKRDIPLKDRDDWEEWLSARRAEHQQRTEAIVRMETDLNARVYTLFELTPPEIAIIEASTKYRYGEV